MWNKNMNSKQFLKEGFLEDAHEAHVDHEVQMARVDCYYAAEHAIVLHKLLRNISEEQGLEGWVASKITLANDYLKSVREHLEYQMMNADADEDDFLPLAEGLSQTKKKVSEDITDRDDGIEEFERGPWYVILRGQPVLEDGTPKRFNWLNGAKTYFRSMMDDDPELAREIKREYDKADDKKAVIYFTKKLPATQTSTQQQTTQQELPAQPVSEAGNKPGLWANIRAKRERIKRGSGERMRKPGSKGAPSNADLKSIRAASNESTELEESLADEFGEFAKKFGQQRGITIKPRDPKPRSPFPEPENKGIDKSLDREALEARLKELQSRFDPAYEYSDDHAFWSEQNEIAKEILSIKRALSQQGVAEDNEQKYRVTYDMYFTNREKPLYTKTRTVRADSEEEAIKIIQDLIGGRNHRIEKDVAEGGILKSIKRGLQGWGTGNAPTPQELVRRNKGHSDDTIKALAIDTRKVIPHSPADLQKRVVDREMKRRGLGEEGVAEGAGEQKYMAVYNKHIGNPSYIGKPITSGGKVIYVTASSKEEASSKFVEIFNRSQVLSSFIGKFVVVPKDADGEQGVAEDSGNAVEALIQVYNNRDQKIIKTKVFASEAEANRWADRNNAVILKLKDVAKKPALDETSSGSVATVVNPTPKNRAKVGTLFGGTYKQTNTRGKK